VLANPASTVTNFAEAWIDLSQSVKRSEDRSQGLTSSLRWMLKSSLGYSDSCESDVFREVSCDESEPSEEGGYPVFEGTLVGDENLGRISCELESISPACIVSIGLFDKGALPRTGSSESIVFERQMLLGKSWFWLRTRWTGAFRKRASSIFQLWTSLKIALYKYPILKQGNWESCLSLEFNACVNENRPTPFATEL